MDIEKFKDEIENEQEGQNFFAQFSESYRIKDDVEYPEPEFLFNFRGVNTIPKGNIIAISAKWKNGKTFFCDCLAAIFLGSERFPLCHTLSTDGKVIFFDTEQAISDTARVRNVIKSMIPEENTDRLEVYCLRNATIDSTENEISRFEFIKKTVEIKKPVLIIIDGIADLIYNYNDVVESQSIVNNLASMANEYNCAIITVMHQNKGKGDSSMKGHIGTMLYQKCSDTFNVCKLSGIFVASHSVSRHKISGDFVFQLDHNGVPIDGTEALLNAEENEKMSKEESLKNKFVQIYNEDKELTSKILYDRIQNKLAISLSHAYRLVKEAIEAGFIVKDKHNYKLKI